MVLDDFPELTLSDVTLQQPSWNLRDVYAGYDADFVVPWSAFPLQSLIRPFGNFDAVVSIRPGTAAIVELIGTPTSAQVVRFGDADGYGLAHPDLRLAIVRVR